ncbi:hypothetical protein D3C87_860100 [compost metagenome]
MPYAVYALNWNKQELHHDFTSRKKNPQHVWGDVIAYIINYSKGLSTDRVETSGQLQKDVEDQHAFILEELPKWTLEVLEVMDKDTEERIDEMLKFLDSRREYSEEFAFMENSEALVLLSRLDFGLRRLIGRRFSCTWSDTSADVKEKNEAEFQWYSGQLRTFNSLLTSTIDMDKYSQLMNAWSPTSLLKDPLPKDVEPNREYIWWTSQADCEGVMAYHEQARLDGMTPWGGPLRDHVFSELQSRHGRHARGTVWGMKEIYGMRDQPEFDEKNEFHRYIIKYCGGVLISYEDLMVVRHNLGFVTDLNLKPIWELK